MTPAITNPSKAMQKILLALALLLTTHTAIAETKKTTAEAEKRLACGDYQPLANAPVLKKMNGFRSAPFPLPPNTCRASTNSI